MTFTAQELREIERDARMNAQIDAADRLEREARESKQLADIAGYAAALVERQEKADIRIARAISVRDNAADHFIRNQISESMLEHCVAARKFLRGDA